MKNNGCLIGIHYFLCLVSYTNKLRHEINTPYEIIRENPTEIRNDKSLII